MTHPRISSSKIAHSLRLKPNIRAGLILTTLMLMVAMTATPASAQIYTDLYNFDGTTAGLPSGTLAQGRDGNLYGTAAGNDATGGNEHGIVFRISPRGRLTVLHSFSGTDGAQPRTLMLATDGNFYGTTGYGGAYNLGTLFRFTPAGSLVTLHTFTGNADGSLPFSTPIQAADGNLYGTTYGGNVYKMTLSGIFTPLASLPGAIKPRGDPIIQGADGNFYGTTTWGGSSDSGTVFQMTPNGVVTVLHEFDGTNGKWPNQLIQASDGNLYGTTENSGDRSGFSGLAYKLTLQGAFTVLHSFFFSSGRANPITSLLEATDGKFYGCTEFGPGSIFQLAPTGAVAVEHTFDKFGVSASTPMQHTNGKIYGLIADGGPLSGGLVYSLDVGLFPFVRLVSTSGKVGVPITILGQGFTGTTDVSFNGIPATFKVWSDTFLKATVPSGATTGPVTVTSPTGTLTSNHPFRVHPVILGVTPGTGVAGTPVVITGTSLTQTTKVTFGGGKAAATFTVDSDSQVTATVPAGAPSGYIGLTTTGGRSRSPDAFTVTP